ncbi:quinone oxidoreductase family protein [Sporosarcina sp. CAU 1771]
MKAIIVPAFGQPDVMQYVDVEMPTITSHQVLIEVSKASVNFADIKARYGNKGNTSFPFTPGLDAAGVIVDIGPEVTELHIGQRVVCFPVNGSYSEYVVANENLTFAIPDEIDFDIAVACTTVGLLSYKLLTTIAKINPGESILIHSSAGGVGTTAIRMAKILGAEKIIGTVGVESKIPTALNAGADHVICYEKEDFAARVNEFTEGKGVNIILDSIAGSITEKSLECLAPYGRLVQFGNSSGQVGQIKTSDLHSSCRSVLGFSLGTSRKLRPELLRNTATQVFQLLEDGKLTMDIGHHFPLKDAVLAHELMESRFSTGKIILDVKN